MVSFDFAWLSAVLFSNIHYLFAFAVLSFFFFGTSVKKIAVSAFLLVIVCWAWVDFELFSGWVLFVGGFLSIYYITKIVVLTFADQMPQLKNHLVLVGELQFLTLLIIYNFFLR